MNPSTLIAVSAYSGDRNQVENNMPVYQHHGCPVLILSPTDAPISDIPGASCQHAGRAGWIGLHTLARQAQFLKILAGSPQKWFLFHDADSVCLSPKLPDYLYQSPGVFWSNEVLDTNPGPSRLPKIALQPPYFFHRSVLRELVRCSATPSASYVTVGPHGDLPTPTECIDHWLLQIVYAAGLQHRSFPDGCSWETTSEHGLNEMRIHVRAGKNFIHQVKSKSVLDILMSEYKARG